MHFASLWAATATASGQLESTATAAGEGDGEGEGGVAFGGKVLHIRDERGEGGDAETLASGRGAVASGVWRGGSPA